jgi:hypothetical protein
MNEVNTLQRGWGHCQRAGSVGWPAAPRFPMHLRNGLKNTSTRDVGDRSLLDIQMQSAQRQ